MTLLFVCLFAVASQVEAPTVAGHWDGAIEIPGTKLVVDVDLAIAADGALTGDVSVPAQALKDIPLVNLSSKGEEVAFEIGGIPGNPTFHGKLSADGATISGSFTQGGATFPFSLARGATAEAKTSDALAGFDEWVEKARTSWEVPGLAIAVVRGGRTVYAKGFGAREVGKPEPVDENTLFAIGSSTKAFTTFVLGTLVDEGKLSWDEPVRRYIPFFELHDEVLTEHVTPRDLVTHRTGLPRHDLLWYGDAKSSRADLVRRLRYLPPSADLRAEWQYNNLMFLTAGFLAETIAGDTWEHLVRARILDPLGMKATNFSVNDSKASQNHASPHGERDGKVVAIPFRDITNMGPAGSINSSAAEMARWVALQLDGGSHDGTALIRKETLDEIRRPSMPTGQRDERPDISDPAYAMGWFVDSYRAHRRVYHGGAIDGFACLVELFPDDGVGLVVLVNKNRDGLNEIVANAAADHLLGLDEVDWLSLGLTRRAAAKKAAAEAEKAKESVRRTGTKPSHPLAEYAGDYEHPGYGVVTVKESGGKLSMVYHGITTPLEHWHYDVFNGAKAEDPVFENAKLLFASDVNGDIAFLEATVEPSVPPQVFEKKADPRLSDPKFLEAFLGDYELATQVMTIGIRGSSLTASLPGQPLYDLVPGLGESFAIEGLSGYSLRFVRDAAGKVTAVRIVQPDGVYEGKRR